MKLFKKLFRLTKSSKKNNKWNKLAPKKGFFVNRPLRWWFFPLGTALCAAGVFVLGWYILQNRYGFSEGDKASATFVVVENMRYVDPITTETLKRSVEEKVAGVVVHDPGKIKSFLRDLGDSSLEGHALFFSSLDPEILRMVSILPLEKREALLEETRSLGLRMLETGIFERDAVESFLWEELHRSSLSWSDQNLVVELLYGLFLRSQNTDPHLTQRLRESLRESVEPVIRAIYRGDVIVEKGEIITPLHARLLRLQGYREALFPWKYLLLLGCLGFFWGFWIQEHLAEISRKKGEQQFSPLFLGCLLLGAWIVEIPARWFDITGIGTLLLGGWSFLSFSSVLAFPFVLGGGILGVLVAGTPFIGMEAAPVLVVAALAYASGLMLRNVQVKKKFWLRFFAAGVAAILVAAGVQWGEGGIPDLLLALRFLVGILACGVLVLLGLPLGERFFDVLSPLRLTELSHPSSPLLKRLQIEAPGTYHHSLMVGTLAEMAAENIGMDGAFVKAGALYHDVGKLRRPQFFIENQQYGAENAHDELSPTLSALIIISHVRDGYELSMEYGVPRKLRQFILEHHGTTCLQYFQKKAESLGEKVSREQFSYPGPPPRSKETALVMLADSVEAAIRADTKSVSRITELEDTIHGVIENKMKEKQLENVDFTFRELERIKKSFGEVMRSMYHSRETVKKEDLPSVQGKEKG